MIMKEIVTHLWGVNASSKLPDFREVGEICDGEGGRLWGYIVNQHQ